jgi:hypothetical protein
MSTPHTLILSAILCVAAGCSSDENSNEKANNDAGVFQGYKDSYDKAQGVEQTLLQADKARRDALQRQE